MLKFCQAATCVVSPELLFKIFSPPLRLCPLYTHLTITLLQMIEICHYTWTTTARW